MPPSKAPKAKKVAKPMDADEVLARLCATTCEENKGENVLLYDVRKCSILADYYVICTGTSEPHLRALRGYLDKELAEQGLNLKNTSGTAGSHWLVLDFGNIVVHLFNQETRDYYKIENLWETGKVIYRSDDADK